MKASESDITDNDVTTRACVPVTHMGLSIRPRPGASVLHSWKLLIRDCSAFRESPSGASVRPSVHIQYPQMRSDSLRAGLEYFNPPSQVILMDKVENTDKNGFMT